MKTDPSVQYIDAAIKSFIGKPAWRLTHITAEATRLLKAAGQAIPSNRTQNASHNPNRIDALRVGVRLWAALPARCPHCSPVAVCMPCTLPKEFVPCETCAVSARAGTYPDGTPRIAPRLLCYDCAQLHAKIANHQEICNTIHDACPRRGVYCSLQERHVLQSNSADFYDASFSYLPGCNLVRAFVRAGVSNDPRSARYRMWQFPVKLLSDETVAGLSRAGSYALLPDPVQEAGDEQLSCTLQSDHVALLAFAFAARAHADHEIPPLPAPNVRLDRPLAKAKR